LAIAEEDSGLHLKGVAPEGAPPLGATAGAPPGDGKASRGEGVATEARAQAEEPMPGSAVALERDEPHSCEAQSCSAPSFSGSDPSTDRRKPRLRNGSKRESTPAPAMLAGASLATSAALPSASESARTPSPMATSVGLAGARPAAAKPGNLTA